MKASWEIPLSDDSTVEGTPAPCLFVTMKTIGKPVETIDFWVADFKWSVGHKRTQADSSKK